MVQHKTKKPRPNFGGWPGPRKVVWRGWLLAANGEEFYSYFEWDVPTTSVQNKLPPGGRGRRKIAATIRVAAVQIACLIVLAIVVLFSCAKAGAGFP
jgi:hypothetical protein